VKATRDGWLNRYLGATNPAGSPLRGVAIARQMPRTLQGPAPALAFGGVEEFVVRGATRSPFQAAYARTGDKLLAATGAETFEADNVVIATGVMQKPFVPSFANELDPRVRHLHSSDYRNLSQLQEGSVLVVGGQRAVR